MTKLPAKVQEFISENKVAHVATISVDQKKPQISTVYYFFKDDILYFATRPESVKVKNILANSNIALVITDSVRLKTLQVGSSAEITNDKNLKKDIVENYNKISNESGPNAFPPLTKTLGFSIEIIKCPVDWFRYSDFSGSKQIIISS